MGALDSVGSSGQRHQAQGFPDIERVVDGNGRNSVRRWVSTELSIFRDRHNRCKDQGPLKRRKGGLEGKQPVRPMAEDAQLASLITTRF